MNVRSTDTSRITQNMIKLFDDYTHLSLDRRKFMNNLAKLAGSMTAATAAAALMASNAKAQGLVSETDDRLAIEEVSSRRRWRHTWLPRHA